MLEALRTSQCRTSGRAQNPWSRQWICSAPQIAAPKPDENNAFDEYHGIGVTKKGIVKWLINILRLCNLMVIYSCIFWRPLLIPYHSILHSKLDVQISQTLVGTLHLGLGETCWESGWIKLCWNWLKLYLSVDWWSSKTYYHVHSLNRPLSCDLPDWEFSQSPSWMCLIPLTVGCRAQRPCTCHCQSHLELRRCWM